MSMMNDQSAQEEGPSESIRAAKAAIDGMLSLAEELARNNPERTLQIGKQAAAACTTHPFDKRPYQTGLAQSYHACAGAYLILADYGKALEMYTVSMGIYRAVKDQQQIASQLNNIGIVYAYSGEYDQALLNLHAAEALLTDEMPPDFTAEVNNNIGYTHVVLGDFAQAIPYLLNSLAAAERIETARALIAQANVHDSLCQAYLALDDPGNALRSGIKSVDLCRQMGDLKKEAEYLLSLGEVYLRLTNAPKARECYQQALRLSEANGFRREEADALRRLGTWNSLQGEHDLALGQLQQALVLARELNIQREIYECHLALAGLYKQTGQFEKALEHFEQFHQVKETLFNAESDRRIRNLEAIHQVEQSHREAELLQQKNKELQSEIEERRRAQELAETLSRTDPLTGIFNRGYFFPQAQRALADCLHNGDPLSVLIGDIDHFKSINDHYGHLAGDRALVRIAEKIGATLRKEDILGRYGGEEFVVLLPRVDRATAAAVAERVREAIEHLEVTPLHPELKVTISLGVTDLPEAADQEDLTLEKLLTQADQAMYAAKHQGRNRVCVHAW